MLCWKEGRAAEWSPRPSSVAELNRSQKKQKKSKRQQGTGDTEKQLPANHFPVPVKRDVRCCLVIIRSKMAIRGSKPLIKSMPQGMELRSVAKVPRKE